MNTCRTCPQCHADGDKDALLNTNAQATEKLCVSCSKLENLNREIDEVKLTFDRLLEQRRAHFEEMNQKFDPIRRLPIELVSSIFTLCHPRLHSLDIFEDVPPNVQMEYADRPVQYLLGSVCRFWRQVAWSTPQLWNVLWLHVAVDTTIHNTRCVADCLSRSGCLPLYIRIFWIPLNNEGKGDLIYIAWEYLATIINDLNQHADRFRVLDLSLLEGHLSQFWKQDSGAANSILERLDIEVINDEMEGIFSFYDDFQDPFQLARKSNPTHVTFKNIRVKAIIDIHWSNITHLEGTFFKHEAVTVLQLAPQLHHFKVGINQCSDHLDEPHAPTISHNALKTLQINWEYQQFLQHLTCPALEKFSFEISYSILRVESFLRRSNSPLKELALGAIQEDIDLESLLQLTPLLTHLTLRLFKFHQLEESLANVSRAVKDNNFLPHLRSFHLTTNVFSPTLISIASDLVAPNNVVRRPWSSIKVAFSDFASMFDRQNNVPFFDRTILSQILWLIEEGVEIEAQDFEGQDLVCLSRQLHGI